MQRRKKRAKIQHVRKSERLFANELSSSVESEKSPSGTKKVLTNAKRCGNLSTVPRLERVPCKLNNEELEKAPDISDV